MNIDLIISIVLSLIMFSVGTSLKVDDFKAIIKRPKLILWGLTLQMLFLPLLAFLVCNILPIDPYFKVGILVLFLCPGGTTSNFIAYLLDLKTALSLALTLFNSLLILVTIPLGVNFFNNYFLQESTQIYLPAYETIFNIVSIVLIPVLLGLAFRQIFPNLVEKLKKLLKYLSTFLLMVIFLVKIFASEEKGGSGLELYDILSILPVLLGLHLVAMVFSFWLARKLKFEQFYAITISIEVGLQNTTLALLITSVFLANNEMSIPSLVYAMFSFFTTYLFGYYLKKRIKSQYQAISKIP